MQHEHPLFDGAGLLRRRLAVQSEEPASPAHYWKLCAMLATSLSETKAFFEVARYASYLVATPMNLGKGYSSCRQARQLTTGQVIL
jgi:hypothetical protein